MKERLVICNEEDTDGRQRDNASLLTLLSPTIHAVADLSCKAAYREIE